MEKRPNTKRNPIAKAVRTARFVARVIPSKLRYNRKRLKKVAKDQ